MAAPPARVMVDTPAGKKSVAATSSAAKSAAPAQKTYNYHKPAEEPFRAPPAQKTYNYHKPVETPSAAPNRAEAYRMATKEPAQAAAPKNFASTPVGSMPKNSDTLLNKAGDFFFPDAFRPLPNSRKSNFAADMASPLLGNAYDLASTAMTMTPDKNSYVPAPVQRLNHYLSNMGLAGLSALAAPVYGAAGLTADVANKLGVPRPEALARDLGAMLDVAGILPEGRMLSAMVPEATTSRVSKVPEDIPTQTPAETLINQTDVAPVAPPAANPLDPFYDPLPPPPNFLMDRPEGYDPFATLRPQNNRTTPEQVDAEVDRIFGPQPLGNVTGPDTEAYAALETAYDNQVPEPDWLDGGPLDPVFPEGYGIDPAQPNPYEDLAQPNPLDPWRHVGEDAPVRPTRTLDELNETRYSDLAFRDDAGEDIPPLTVEERRELLDYTFDDYLNRVNADPDTLPPEQYEGQNRLDLDTAIYRLEQLTGDDRYARYARMGEGGPPTQRPQLRLRPLDATRTLEELAADPEYQNLITGNGNGGNLNTLTTEQKQSLLDSTFDEFLHLVDMPGLLDRPAGERRLSNVVTRLEALTGQDYRFYAFLGEGNAPTQRPQLRPENFYKFTGPIPKLKPLTAAGEGIASMYSPTRRAVDQLRQSRFPDPVSMEKQLLAMGAKPDELESILARIKESDVTEGGIKKLRLAELADEASNDIQQFRSPDTEYSKRHPNGAIDPHVTTFEAPVNDVPEDIGQHFNSKLPANGVLAHIRSAMFHSLGSKKPNVYHLSEIQSDWAQFRVELFADRKQEIEALLEGAKRVKELEAAGKNPASDALMKKLYKRSTLTEKYGYRSEFDKDYPAPFVKTTRKWHQLCLKQALIEAVNSGAEYMSISTGNLAKSFTGGKLEGQQMFYDQMTPRELDDILTKFSKETGVEKPVIEPMWIHGSGKGMVEEPVPAIRLTDEFREAMKKYGLPSFAKGGIVTLPT